MATKTVLCKIEGLPPGLLMHSYPMEPVKNPEKMSKEEQAKLAEYRSPEGELFVPALNVQRMLVAAAAFSKGKGRASLSKIVAAVVSVNPSRLILTPQKYVVDSRRVVVPATKGSVIRHRPCFEEWSLEFEIAYDAFELTEGQVRQVVDDAGSKVGLLDFRPAKTGPFGRFMVVKWEAK